MEPACRIFCVDRQPGEAMAKSATGAAVRWTAAATLIAAAATGWGRADYEDGTGFQDGFLAGYGRDCALRSPPVEKRWRSSAYSRGYADGIDNGIQACQGLRHGADGTVLATAAVARPRAVGR
jgi:hypothetical protein